MFTKCKQTAAWIWALRLREGDSVLAPLRVVAWMALLVLLLPAPAEAAAVEPPSAPSSACTLLADDDLLAIQGAAPQNRKASGWVADFAISQCYFELPTAAQSVSLAVFERAAGRAAQRPRQAWAKMFAPHGKHPETHEGQREPEPEASLSSPQPVAGVGDAAYWSPSRVGGFLYVLRGPRFFRIGVGGVGTPAQRQQKAIRLARIVCRHWPSSPRGR